MKVFKKLAAAGAALMMAVTGMAMTSIAYSESDYTETLIPLHYAPYSSVHTSDSVNVRLRVASGAMAFNTTVSKTGSGQLNVSSLTANSTLTITKTGNYTLSFVGSQAGDWKTVYYWLSNYGTYSTVNVSGNVSN